MEQLSHSDSFEGLPVSDNWLDLLGPKARREELASLTAEREGALAEARWAPLRELLARLSDIKASSVDIDRASISIGQPIDLNEEQSQRLRAALEELRPWKKGPFSLFGIDIDAEWRSDLKWNRLADAVGSLEGQLVADIGCHNGYFMYRMLAHGARAVVGFEPYARLRFVFDLLQGFHRFEPLHFSLLGVEHFDLCEESFDTIFCLGILYHHTDPVGLLRKLRRALRPGARLFVDCQGIPGTESLALVPEGRYAGASGIWFLPTLSALRSWAKRSGFSRIETIFSEPLSVVEQRPTAWAAVDSLEHFLDPTDSSRTIEGYPAPWRHYVLLKA